MSGWDLAVIWLSLGLAWWPAVWCIRASRHGWRDLRGLLLLQGLTFGSCGVSYVWLLTHLHQAAEWSRFMRPIGLMQIVIAGEIARRVHRLERQAAAHAEQLLSDTTEAP